MTSAPNTGRQITTTRLIVVFLELHGFFDEVVRQELLIHLDDLDTLALIWEMGVALDHHERFLPQDIGTVGKCCATHPEIAHRLMLRVVPAKILVPGSQ